MNNADSMTFSFNKLTPTNKVDLEGYEDAFKFVFANDDLKNIAISGAYGSGKSSLLKTYRDTHKDIRFMNISLASFSTENYSETTPKKNNILEGKILNQLLHQIEEQNIPLTNFRIKKSTSSKSIWNIVGLIIVLLSTGIYLLKYRSLSDFIREFQQFNSMDWLLEPVTVLVISILFLSSLGVALYKIVQLQKEYSLIKKISTKNLDIEIFEHAEDSYFDKYLNEVLYLFDNADVDVIVFEDLDRFDNTDIFQRLREINYLINKRREKQGEYKPLRFFYLIKDDLFQDKDRTKFFDFMIPVIPVIDGSNSFNVLKEKLSDIKLFDKFNIHFLREISVYIDDMRILSNILNEFQLYYSRLNKIELDLDKLLAIVIYKNIFPSDFHNLQIGKGYVHTIFSHKHEYQTSAIQTAQTKVDEIEQLIDDIKNNAELTEEEIEYLYTNKPEYITTDGWYNNITKPELIAIKNRRVEVSREQAAKNLNRHIRLLNRAKQELAKCYSNTLSTILSGGNADSIFEIQYENALGETDNYDEIKRNPYFDLLKLMLKRGYIDETYPDYMSYFYDNSLTINDKNFVITVLEGRQKDYSYPIENPPLTLSHFSNYFYGTKSMLNFNILDHLLNTPDKYEDQLDRLLKYLADNESYDFIREFLKATQHEDIFIDKLCTAWPEFIKMMQDYSNYQAYEINKIILLCVYYLDQGLKSDQIISDIAEYISTKPDFLDIPSPDIQQIIFFIKANNIKVNSIDWNKANMNLVTAIYENDCYDLNWQLIVDILIHIYKISDTHLINHRNLTAIMSDKMQPLYKYISANIEEYMAQLLSNTDDIGDDENTILTVLTCKDIKEKTKISYIAKLSTVLSDIRQIPYDLWDIVLEHKLIKHNARNCMTLYVNENHNYSSKLLNFINEQDTDFTGIKSIALSEESEENPFKTFVKHSYECKGLKPIRYEKLIEELDEKYELATNNAINEKMLEILILHNQVEMTPANLSIIQIYYSNLLKLFIKSDIEEYMHINSNGNVSLEEILSLMSDNDISSVTKNSLLDLLPYEISINYDCLSDNQIIHILENKFDIADIYYLIDNYKKFSSKIQTIINRLLQENFSYIINNGYRLPHPVEKIILKDNKTEKDLKIGYLYQIMDNVDFKEFIPLVLLINDPISNGILNKEQTEYPSDIKNTEKFYYEKLRSKMEAYKEQTK